jgi:hypothetical protein
MNIIVVNLRKGEHLPVRLRPYTPFPSIYRPKQMREKTWDRPRKPLLLNDPRRTHVGRIRKRVIIILLPPSQQSLPSSSRRSPFHLVIINPIIEVAQIPPIRPVPLSDGARTRRRRTRADLPIRGGGVVIVRVVGQVCGTGQGEFARTLVADVPWLDGRGEVGGCGRGRSSSRPVSVIEPEVGEIRMYPGGKRVGLGRRRCRSELSTPATYQGVRERDVIDSIRDSLDISVRFRLVLDWGTHALVEVERAEQVLVCAEEHADVLAVRVVLDELDVADNRLAGLAGFCESVLDVGVGRDGFLLPVDKLEGIDETGRAQELSIPTWGERMNGRTFDCIVSPWRPRP